MIADTANSPGIADVLDEHLAGLTPDTITHTAGTVLTSMAVALTARATCLDYLNLLNPLVNTGLTRPIGSETTAHRQVHQLADRVNVVDAKMSQARRTSRTQAWNALGTLNPTTCATTADPSIIDIDASLIHIHSNKEHAAPTYKGCYGFHPLCAFVDHGSGLSGEPLALLMRPGNAGANNADDVKQGVLRPGAACGVTDTDTAYVAAIAGLVTTGKSGEYGINLTNFPPNTRVIVRVDYPAAGCQLRITDVDSQRVTAFIANSDSQPQVLDLRHRGRGRCEQRIKDAKDHRGSWGLPRRAPSLVRGELSSPGFCGGSYGRVSHLGW